MQAADSGRSHTAASTSTGSNVLEINHKKLKAQDELRRIFGSKIISQDSREDESGTPSLQATLWSSELKDYGWETHMLCHRAINGVAICSKNTPRLWHEALTFQRLSLFGIEV